MADHDHDAPAADRAADQGPRDEPAAGRPGAEAPARESTDGPAPAGEAGAGEWLEPGHRPDAGQGPDAGAGTPEGAPQGRLAEEAPYLPPGPNPFPSAWSPPAREAAYDASAGGYREHSDESGDWYDETGHGPDPLADYPHLQAHFEGPDQSASEPDYQAPYQPQDQPQDQQHEQQQDQRGYTPKHGPGDDPGGDQAGNPGAGPPGYPEAPPGFPHPGTPMSGAEALAPLPPRAGGRRSVGTADSLSAETLLRRRPAVPKSGWRRAVYFASAGLVRPGESPAELRRREMMARARTSVAGGHHRVAVLSLKGGVGKTTTTVGLGSTLASLRGDRVIAVDANPDRGTLSDKVRLETAATVRDLLHERTQIRRYADVRAFTSQSPSRLEMLASDRDPAVSIAFSEYDYCEVARVLEYHYSICITDCGTGLLHSAMAGVLALADQIILVSSPSVDGARSADATLDWLDAHDYGDLVRNAVVVLSVIRARSKSTVDVDRLEKHFAGRCRAVCRIPYDPYLEEGAEVDLERLAPETADAYLELSATVGDSFAWPRKVQQAAAR